MSLIPIGTRVTINSLFGPRYDGLKGTIVKHRKPVIGRQDINQYPYAVELAAGITLPFKADEVRRDNSN